MHCFLYKDTRNAILVACPNDVVQTYELSDPKSTALINKSSIVWSLFSVNIVRCQSSWSAMLGAELVLDACCLQLSGLSLGDINTF
jgi:hypothetical protein